MLGLNNIRLTPVYEDVCECRMDEIYMRDPFIFTDTERSVYFLYGTNINTCDGAANIDPFFECWVSKDLELFSGPYLVFRPEKGFWGVKHYWAPEVHKYKDHYYMFASFKGGIGEDRGTAILRAEYPEGPFKEWSRGHVTLQGHECLDGTLFVDRDSKPWVVFCHEWTEMYYGKIKALPLSTELNRALTQQTITIVDTEHDNIPWIRKMEDPRVRKDGYLTDAPFFYRLRNGSLLMIWSSYSIPGYQGKGDGGYVIAGCLSRNGSLEGPWEHLNELLLDKNTGHSAFFTDLNGNLKLVSHTNDTEHGHEHPTIFDVEETTDMISIKWGK